MYGESVFTTMRMINGFLRDWELHFDRLKKGVEFVYGPFLESDWDMGLKNRLESRCLMETGDKVIRLTVYREQTRGLLRSGLMGLSDLKIHLSSTPFDPSRFEGKALVLRTCAATPRPHWWPSYLKAGSYLETILAQKRTMQEGDDDILFLSSHDTLLESSVANIFVVRHKKLYTPPLGPNVLDGVMRRKIIECALEFFDDVQESETSMDQIFRADGVFGCNSVRGPFLVERVDDHDINFDQSFLSAFEKLRSKVFQ